MRSGGDVRPGYCGGSRPVADGQRAAASPADTDWLPRRVTGAGAVVALRGLPMRRRRCRVIGLPTERNGLTRLLAYVNHWCGPPYQRGI